MNDEKSGTARERIEDKNWQPAEPATKDALNTEEARWTSGFAQKVTETVPRSGTTDSSPALQCWDYRYAWGEVREADD